MSKKHTDNEAFVRWIQGVVGVRVDGWAGDETRRAVERELMGDEHRGFDSAAFFRNIRSQLFGGSMTQSQVDGTNAILDGFKGQPLTWTAYALATAYHEVAKTMQPISEYGKGKGRAYGVPGRNKGQVAYGRGLVQLTWDENYERADKELGLGGALVQNYELALDPKIAVAIMLKGMVGGWFTGKRFLNYLPDHNKASRDQYMAARRIINGTDRADLIAGYALAFQSALQAGGWR